ETCNTFTCAQLMIVDLRHELSPSRIASSVSSFFFSPDRSYVLYVTYSNEGTSVYRHNISLGENDLIYEVAGNRDIDLLGSSADNSFIIFREGNTLYRAKNGEAEVLFEPLQREWEDYYYQLSNDGAKALVIRDIAPPSGNGAHIFLYSLFDVYKKEIKTLENVPQSYSYGFTEDSEDMYALENRAEWRDINNPTFSSTYWIYDPQTADYEKIFSSIRGEILLPPLDEEHFLISRLRVLDDSGRRSTTFFLEPPSFGSNQLVIETAKYELVPFLGWLEN
ncbi:MAG TPA: hypothetical protein VGA94_01350, partial [Thermodesulfobacteriota bacterium]